MLYSTKALRINLLEAEEFDIDLLTKLETVHVPTEQIFGYFPELLNHIALTSYISAPSSRPDGFSQGSRGLAGKIFIRPVSRPVAGASGLRRVPYPAEIIQKGAKSSLLKCRLGMLWAIY